MFHRFSVRECWYCHHNCTVIVERPSLMTQSIITILTCGLWLPFALTCYRWGTKYKCMNCGQYT